MADVICSKPGIYPNIRMADYVSDPCPQPSISAGAMKTVLTKSVSVARSEHPRLGRKKKKETDATRKGNLQHAALLGDPEIVYVDFNDWRKGEAKELKKKIEEEGKIPALEKEREEVEEMRDVALNCLQVNLLGEPYKTEVTCISKGLMGYLNDDIIDVWYRCRPDILVESMSLIVDYKTNKAEDLYEAMKALYAECMYLSAPHYTNILSSLTGKKYRYVWLFQEKQEPYDCHLVELDKDGLKVAEADYWRAVESWVDFELDIKKGVKANSGGVVQASPPEWLKRRAGI